MAYNFGDVVKLKDGFVGKITGRTNSNPAFYDVTDANNKRVNGVPEKAIEQQNRDAAKSILTEADLKIIQRMIEAAIRNEKYKQATYEEA
jgi:uncharacterized protein YkvS